MFKTTNFIFCTFSDVNDNKMVFVTTLKCFLFVIIIMQKLHFKNNTAKKQNSVLLENGMRYFRKPKIREPAIMYQVLKN